MIEAGGPIEFRDERRQINAESPLVGPASGAVKCALPGRPPSGNRSRERLHDEHAIADRGALEQTRQQRVAALVIELVDDKRRQDHCARPRKGERGRIGSNRPRVKAELAVCVSRLRQRPRMRVDADDVGTWVTDFGARGTSGTRAAAEVD